MSERNAGRDSATLQDDTATGSPPRRGMDSELARVLGPVLFLTLVFLIHFIVRQIAGPSLPSMETELELSHSQSGLFILLMGLGFSVSQLGASVLAARFGYRRCIMISLWGSAGAAAALSLIHSMWLLYPFFLLLGISGGLYVPTGIAKITLLVRPQDWGKALGIHELAPNIALISVPFLATAAIGLGSWRLGYQGCAVVLALLGLVYFKVGHDVETRPSPPSLRLIREVIAKPAFWRLGLLLSLAVGVETGVYAMIPLYLVSERGYELAQANQLLGLSRVPGVFMVLIVGWLSDRLHPPATIAMALAVTGLAIVVLGLGPDSLVVAAVFLQSAASASLFPPMLALASATAGENSRALTLSLSLAVAPLLGGGVLPAAIAAAGDLSSFGIGMTAAGLLVLSGILLVKR